MGCFNTCYILTIWTEEWLLHFETLYLGEMLYLNMSRKVFYQGSLLLFTYWIEFSWLFGQIKVTCLRLVVWEFFNDRSSESQALVVMMFTFWGIGLLWSSFFSGHCVLMCKKADCLLSSPLSWSQSASSEGSVHCCPAGGVLQTHPQ